MAHVAQINVSDGGVPKKPVESVDVGERGLAGDRQEDTKHHGGPDQALCLYSLEVIEGLQAEGHPIAPGSAGENFTLAGLPWSQMRPGVRIRIGGVLAEVTFPAVPCGKNRQWFLHGEYRRMSHDLHPGWSRWYARVLEPGAVTTGDPVELLET